jgi:RNA polymerase sigma factor (sigma-70 family)
MNSSEHTATFVLPKLNRREMAGDLYRKYGRKLYAYAVHTWKMDEDETWDLIYKTLYKVIDSHHNYSFVDEEKFASFIFRIFINYMRNHYRDHKAQKEAMKMTGLEEAEHIGQNHKVEASNESTDSSILLALKKELDQLEDWQRILLLMRSDGRPYSEIAEYVNKPEEQLKVYYQRLKKAIAERMYGKE